MIGIVIRDAEGREIGYLPVSLISGEESPVIPLQVTPSAPNERLRASYSPDIIIYGKVAGGAFIDLSNPVDVGIYYGTTFSLEMKLKASALITGVRRIGLYLGASLGEPAGWLL